MKRKTVGKILVCVFVLSVFLCSMPSSISAAGETPLSGISDKSMWKFVKMENSGMLEWFGVNKLLASDSSWNRDEWAVLITYGTPFKNDTTKKNYPDAKWSTGYDAYTAEDYWKNGDLNYISGSTTAKNYFVGSNLKNSALSDFDGAESGVQFLTSVEGLPVLEYVEKNSFGMVFNIRLREGNKVTSKYLCSDYSKSYDSLLASETKGKICIAFAEDNYNYKLKYDDDMTAAKMLIIPEHLNYYMNFAVESNGNLSVDMSFYGGQTKKTNTNFWVWVGHKVNDIGYNFTNGTYIVREGETFYSGTKTIIDNKSKLIIGEKAAFVVTGYMYVAGTIELRGGTLIVEFGGELYTSWNGKCGCIIGGAKTTSGQDTSSNIIIQSGGFLNIQKNSDTGGGYINANSTEINCAGNLVLSYATTPANMIQMSKSSIKVETGGKFYTQKTGTFDNGLGSDGITYLSEPCRYVNIDKNISRSGKTDESGKVL